VSDGSVRWTPSQEEECVGFLFFKRNDIYYVQLYNPKTGINMSARSTGKKNLDEAAGVAIDWIAFESPSL
jgi:hypothetical protein